MVAARSVHRLLLARASCALAALWLCGCPTVLIASEDAGDGADAASPPPDGGEPAADAGDGACPTNPVAGLTVTAFDGESNARICDGTVFAVEGAYSEQLRTSGFGETCAWFGIFERAGLYDVTITATGYLPDTVRAYRIEVDDCGDAVPRNLVFQLVRAPLDGGQPDSGL